MALHTEIPLKTGINTFDQQRVSGLTTITQIANEIMAGKIGLVLVSIFSALPAPVQRLG
jgi:acetyl-CoA acetyltransferase